ncbi:SpoIIE family protein phosphatase [Flammeovirga aprica]|uniref:SpoIIE family protein phosphatase n=1 Tax=Flammeovirga aprica JL-4 TaxID=694437 RepID=A0A7X9RU15_9BACT|nr:SpoIIE family protein phosphatase [Flammeovirga aprica]NME68509.1 SpoIIE family protein phosphatase [Flammeovirga aprica JL-4]
MSIKQGMKMEDSANKVEVLSAMALLEIEKNPSSQKEPFLLINQAIRTAKKISNNQSLAMAYNTKAIIFREFSTFSQAVSFHQKAIKLSEKSTQESDKVNFLLDLGATYRVSLDFENAKSSFEEAQALSNTLQLPILEVISYLNIGFLYTSLEIQDEALPYFEKAEKIASENSIKDAYILAIIGKGINYSLGNDPALSKAKKFFVQAVTSSKKNEKKYFEGVSRIFLGRTYLRMNKISDAYRQLNSSVGLLEKYKYKPVLKVEYRSLDDVMKFRNFYSQALSYFNSIKYYRGEISQSQYNAAVKEELELFGNPDQDELEQLRDALAELKNHYSFLDSINQLDEEEAVYLLKNYLDQQNNKMNSLESDRSYLKKLLEETEKAAKQKIEILEQKNQLQKALISKQYWAAATLLLLLVSLGVVGSLQYKNAIQRKKTNLELKARNEKISEQNFEIRSTANQLEDALSSLQHQSKKTEESIHAGWRIQNAMLPAEKSFSDFFATHFVMYQPRDIVSGDFYWVGQKNQQTIIAALDCTGHGIPGAFMSMMGNALMNQVVNIEGLTSPSEILAKIDKYIAQALHQDENEDSREGMDVAICTIAEDKKSLQYAGAKNPLLVVKNNGQHEFYKGTNRHVGGNRVKNKQKTYEEHNITIDSTDTFYIYSDGIQDQFGGQENKKYMRKQLIEDLCKWNQLPLAQQKENMIKKFDNWKNGSKQIDDILLIGFKC